jgi:hypothetical protein
MKLLLKSSFIIILEGIKTVLLKVSHLIFGAKNNVTFLPISYQNSIFTIFHIKYIFTYKIVILLILKITFILGYKFWNITVTVSPIHVMTAKCELMFNTFLHQIHIQNLYHWYLKMIVCVQSPLYVQSLYRCNFFVIEVGIMVLIQQVIVSNHASIKLNI